MTLNPQITNFLWSLALLFGCWGIGNPITKKINAPNWSSAPIGCAIIILIGGWLDMLGLANREAMTWVALAALALGAIQYKDFVKTVKSTPNVGWLAWGSAAVVAWIGAEHMQYMVKWDDATGYIPVCHELSYSGRSWAPFSLRRALSWGGQFPLQNLGMLWTQDFGAYVYEQCLGTWMWATLAAYIGKNIKSWQGAFVALAIPILPQINVNSAPSVTVGIILLAAWTIRHKPWAYGAVAAALLALRLQCVPMLGIITLWTIWEQSGWKNKVNWTVKAGLIGTITLCPFVINHVWQFKTPLPMIWPGTIDPEHLSWIYSWKSTRTNLYLLLLGQSILLPTIWSCSQKATRGLGVAALVTLLYFVLSMPEYSTSEWIRYFWPIGLAAVIGCINHTPNPKGWISCLAVAPFIISPFSTLYMKVERSRAISGVPAAATNPITEVVTNATTDGTPASAITKLKPNTNRIWNPQEGSEAQLKIPEGKRIATILLETNFLDFGRNKIVNLDEFTAIGHTPITSNLADWQDWAEKIGVDYLLHVNFESKIEGAPNRTAYLAPINQDTNLAHYRRVWWPKRKLVIDAIRDLELTAPHEIYEGLIILDLRRPEKK